MLREDRELLTELKRICNEAGPFALEYMAGSLSVEAEGAYAFRIADVAGRLLFHARKRKAFVVDAEPTQLIIDAPSVWLESELRELPPGSEPGDDDRS